MSVLCHSSGLTVQVESMQSQWIAFAREACAGQEAAERSADVYVVISNSQKEFDLTGYEPLTRGAWSDGTSVVLHDACGSGADLLLSPRSGSLGVTARIRPSWRHRGLGVLAPARATLLSRAALIQYPTLWWAGVRGLAPLHVSAAVVGDCGVLIGGPGGVGKSTLLRTLGPAGGQPVSDNLCVSDGVVVHGLLEPARTEGGQGRRMPHGRREAAWARRLESVAPQHIMVLRRGSGDAAAVRPLSEEETARVMTGGTYAAGELRRYWAFAATLGLGTGLGPAHPPVEAVARQLAGAVPCTEVVLPATPGVSLASIVAQAEAAHSSETAGA